MTTRLDGKVALVTGAGGDIGSETVALFLERGAAVFGTALSEAGIARLIARTGPHERLATGCADVSREADVKAMVAAAQARFGRIDILFNNAGIEGGPTSAWKLSAEMSQADFDLVFAVNVSGVFLCMKHVIPLMAKQGSGSIVNMSSVAGIRPAAGQIAYAASKAAVIGMTRTAALEWGEAGVRVNCVNPGPIEGRMMEAIASGIVASRGAEPPGLRTTLVPLGRWGRVGEVAAVVAFLASDRARFVTGSAYPIDGGFTA